MKFTSDINSRAKEIREEAAVRFGGKAQDYNWQEAVKLACDGFEFEAKKEMETKIVKTWQTSNGANIEVKGELILEKDVWLDGDTDTVPACDLKLNVYANGKSQGSWIRKLTERQKSEVPEGFTHYVGQLLLTDQHVTIIRGVKADLEKHPAWIAKQTKIAKNQAEIAEYNKVLETIKLQEGE